MHSPLAQQNTQCSWTCCGACISSWPTSIFRLLPLTLQGCLTLQPMPSIATIYHAFSMPSTGQPVASSGAHLPQGHAPVLHILQNHVSHDLGQALALTTVQSYWSGRRSFTCFCCDAGLQPLPLTETLLSPFVSHLATEGLAHPTIKSSLTSLPSSNSISRMAMETLFSQELLPACNMYFGGSSRPLNHHSPPPPVYHSDPLNLFRHLVQLTEVASCCRWLAAWVFRVHEGWGIHSKVCQGL